MYLWGREKAEAYFSPTGILTLESRGFLGAVWMVAIHTCSTVCSYTEDACICEMLIMCTYFMLYFLGVMIFFFFSVGTVP